MSQAEDSTPAKPRLRRRLFKWVFRGFLGLIALSAVILISADLLRQHRMAKEAERLSTAMTQVETDILEGKSPAEWQAARVKGTNGWKHLAEWFQLHERAWRMDEWDHESPKPDFVRRWEAIIALSDWHGGLWQGKLVDDAAPDTEPPTTPSEELYTEWLSLTDPVAAAFASTAEYDTIVRLPYGDEPYPDWEGVPVIPRLELFRSILARCKIMFNRGDNDRAWRELQAYLELCSKLSAPTSLVDHMTAVGVWSIGIEFVTEQLLEGNATAEQARTAVIWRHDIDAGFQAALEGEAVWLYTGATSADYARQPPTMFDWLTGDIPPGSGMFAMDSHFNSIRSRYFGPANIGHEVSMTIENAMSCVEFSKRPQPWDPEDLPLVEQSNTFAFYPSLVFFKRNELVRTTLRWLELELRLLELEDGPLFEQKNAVAQLVETYEDAQHGWDGERLGLCVDTELRLAGEIALAMNPENRDSRAKLVEAAKQNLAFDLEEESTWDIWIEPRR